MPLGELLDFIDIYKIYNGAAEEVDVQDEQYIPNLR